eukprot:1760604-Prymnesium_polylepis.1
MQVDAPGISAAGAATGTSSAPAPPDPTAGTMGRFETRGHYTAKGPHRLADKDFNDNAGQSEGQGKLHISERSWAVDWEQDEQNPTLRLRRQERQRHPFPHSDAIVRPARVRSARSFR